MAFVEIRTHLYAGMFKEFAIRHLTFQIGCFRVKSCCIFSPCRAMHSNAVQRGRPFMDGFTVNCMPICFNFLFTAPLFGALASSLAGADFILA